MRLSAVASVASSAMIEARRPTTNGAIIDGKTTISRSGTRGSWAMCDSGLDIFRDCYTPNAGQKLPASGKAGGRRLQVAIKPRQRPALHVQPVTVLPDRVSLPRIDHHLR